MSQSTETVLDVNQSTNDFIWRRHLTGTLTTLGITVVIYIALGYFEYSSLLNFTTLDTNSAQKIALIFISPLLIPSITYWRIRSKMRKLFYSQLATTLGFVYSASADMSSVSGQLFDLGTSHTIGDVLTGTSHGLPIRLFNYSYSTGSGKERHTYRYIVGEITNEDKLPELLIKSKSHFLFSINNPFESWQPPKTKELSLEGNFNDHFTVYVAEDAEIEALQVLEPDMMVMLMDGYADFSLECRGNKIYVFKKGSLAENRTDLTALITLLERLYSRLIPELANIGLK